MRKVSMKAAGQWLMVLGCLIPVTAQGMKAVLGGALEAESSLDALYWSKDTNHCSILARKALRHLGTQTWAEALILVSSYSVQMQLLLNS